MIADDSTYKLLQGSLAFFVCQLQKMSSRLFLVKPRSAYGKPSQTASTWRAKFSRAPLYPGIEAPGVIQSE
jgi:hypothetical protein